MWGMDLVSGHLGRKGSGRGGAGPVVSAAGVGRDCRPEGVSTAARRPTIVGCQTGVTRSLPSISRGCYRVGVSREKCLKTLILGNFPLSSGNGATSTGVARFIVYTHR